MMKRILIALDGSDYGKAATEYGLWLAGKFDAALSGVHVVDIVSLEGPFLHDLSGSLGFEPYLNFSAKMREALEDRGRSILSTFEETCSAAGVETETDLKFGVVVNELCEKAKFADLVVMGRRGVNAKFEHGLLGSATEGAIRRSPKPVLIVPREFTEAKKPLLAFDGSPNASKAMHSAAEWAKALALPLTVVHVMRKEGEDSVLKEAEKYFEGYSIEVDYRSLVDESTLGIEKFYRDGGFDLLFMGTSHHSRFVEMVLGSTTEHVVRSVRGPFFLER